MIPDWIFQVLTVVGALGVGYAAIRSDLAMLNEKAENAGRSADRAHVRIDLMMEKGKQ